MGLFEAHALVTMRLLALVVLACRSAESGNILDVSVVESSDEVGGYLPELFSELESLPSPGAGVAVSRNNVSLPGAEHDDEEGGSTSPGNFSASSAFYSHELFFADDDVDVVGGSGAQLERVASLEAEVEALREQLLAEKRARAREGALAEVL